MVPGLEMATQMVLDLCGGTPSEIAVAGRSAHADERIIDFPVAEVKRLSGLDVPLPEMRRVLGRLGFFVAGRGERVKIAVPSWRADVEGKADIVEEVVRIVGVDRCRRRRSSAARRRASRCSRAIQVRDAQGQARARRARSGRGRDLVVHRPKPTPNCSAAASRSLRSPIRSPPICPTCGRASSPAWSPRAQKNADRGFPDVGLFEVGQVFRGDAPEDQLTAAAGVRRALAKPSGIGRHWASATARSTRSTPRPTRSPCWLRPARRRRRCRSCPADRPGFIPAARGTIQIGPQNVLGHFGELHPRALEALDAEGPLVGFEVILERIPEPKAKATRAKPALELSPFQPVERDFAFVVERNVKAADIVRAAQSVDRKLIAGVTVFDVYEGKGIEPGKKSIAIAVTIQPRDKTMTDAEIDALAAKIVAEVGKRTGGVLRA